MTINLIAHYHIEEYKKRMDDMWINVTQHYCKSLNQILEYEAHLTECLNCFMCKVIEEELDKIEEVDKRIVVFKGLLDSYNNRTCAVSKLISSSGCLLEGCDYKCYSQQGCYDNILDKISDNHEVYDINYFSKCLPCSSYGCKYGCSRHCKCKKPCKHPHFKTSKPGIAKPDRESYRFNYMDNKEENEYMNRIGYMNNEGYGMDYVDSEAYETDYMNDEEYGFGYMDDEEYGMDYMDEEYEEIMEKPSHNSMHKKPFGRPPFSKPSFGRPPFGRPPFGRPPVGRPPFVGKPPVGKPCCKPCEEPHCKPHCCKPCCKPCEEPHCKPHCYKPCCKPCEEPHCKPHCCRPCCKPCEEPHCKPHCCRPCCKPCEEPCCKPHCYKPCCKPCEEPHCKPHCYKPCYKPCEEPCYNPHCCKPCYKPCEEPCCNPHCCKPCYKPCEESCCYKPCECPCCKPCEKPHIETLDGIYEYDNMEREVRPFEGTSKFIDEIESIEGRIARDLFGKEANHRELDGLDTKFDCNDDEKFNAKHIGNKVYYLGKVRIIDSCNKIIVCNHMLYDAKIKKLYFCKANNCKNVRATYWV
ncbi:hypothetical protein [Clostridium sp. B9]|uniref:hypothetical protein n=1 Tax=Clostridium sp. B9 TaxID=3423224 RepID=UPI003D2F0A87